MISHKGFDPITFCKWYRSKIEIIHFGVKELHSSLIPRVKITGNDHCPIIIIDDLNDIVYLFEIVSAFSKVDRMKI